MSSVSMAAPTQPSPAPPPVQVNPIQQQPAATVGAPSEPPSSTVMQLKPINTIPKALFSGLSPVNSRLQEVFNSVMPSFEKRDRMLLQHPQPKKTTVEHLQEAMNGYNHMSTTKHTHDSNKAFDFDEEINHSSHTGFEDPLAPFTSLGELAKCPPHQPTSLLPPTTTSLGTSLIHPSHLAFADKRLVLLSSLPGTSLCHDTKPSLESLHKRKRRNFTEHPPNEDELHKVETRGCQNRFTPDQIKNAELIPKRAQGSDDSCYFLLPCPVHGPTRHSQRSDRDLSLKCLECMSVNTWLWSKRQKSELSRCGGQPAPKRRRRTSSASDLQKAAEVMPYKPPHTLAPGTSAMSTTSTMVDLQQRSPCPSVVAQPLPCTSAHVVHGIAIGTVHMGGPDAPDCDSKPESPSCVSSSTATDEPQSVEPTPDLDDSHEHQLETGSGNDSSHNKSTVASDATASKTKLRGVAAEVLAPPKKRRIDVPQVSKPKSNGVAEGEGEAEGEVEGEGEVAGEEPLDTSLPIFPQDPPPASDIDLALQTQHTNPPVELEDDPCA